MKVETSFVPLPNWILSKWQGQQLALALDATLLGDRLAVLAVSVLYRYGLRAWIEHGFKFIKSAGWQWHRTRSDGVRVNVFIARCCPIRDCHTSRH